MAIGENVKTWQALIIFFSFGFIMFYFLFRDYSEPVIYKIQEQQLPKINIEQLFNDSNPQNELVKLKLQKIYDFMQDTLTDEEEGKILKIIVDSKTDSSLNLLINKLVDSKLYENLVIRDDEELECYFNISPGKFEKLFANLVGIELPKEPIDNNFQTMSKAVFEEVFTYQGVQIETGRKLLSVFNFISDGKEYKSAKDTESSLQKKISEFVVLQEINDLPLITIELAKEVLSEKRAEYAGCRNCSSIVATIRHKLGMNEVK